MNPLITIIFPIYNTEKFVHSSLSSCINQSAASTIYEIIIINDGTPDNSMDIVRELIAGHNNIKLIEQENCGLSVARNNAAKAARGHYIWFVDSDDMIQPSAIAILNKTLIELERQPDIIAINASSNIPGAPERMPYLGKYSNSTVTGVDILSEEIAPNAQFYIFRKKFLQDYKLEFFPGIFFEDMEFTPRALFLTSNIYVLNKTLYKVTINNASITRSPVSQKKILDNITVAEHLLIFAQSIPNSKQRKFIYRHINSPLNVATRQLQQLPNSKDIMPQIYRSKKLFRYLFWGPQPFHKIESLLSFLPAKMFFKALDIAHRYKASTKKSR